MGEVKLTFTADECRVFHDIVAVLTMRLLERMSSRQMVDVLDMKLRFVILQRLLQKKLAAKVVFLQQKNTFKLSYDQAIVVYQELGELDMFELDEFSGAVVCGVISEIEPKILSHVSHNGTK